MSTGIIDTIAGNGIDPYIINYTGDYTGQEATSIALSSEKITVDNIG